MLCADPQLTSLRPPQRSFASSDRYATLSVSAHGLLFACFIYSSHYQAQCSPSVMCLHRLKLLLLNVQIGEIHGLLDAAAVDYRDCFERHELVQRLQSAEASLPAHVKVLPPSRHSSKQQCLAKLFMPQSQGMLLEPCCVCRASWTTCYSGRVLLPQRQPHLAR